MEFRKKFGPQKYRIMELPGSQESLTMLSRFDTIPACDGQTDGRTDEQTDRSPAYSYNVRSKTDEHYNWHTAIEISV